MREKKRYTVITFRSTSDAMAMEKYCTAQKVPGRIIPTPREISASCGLSWRMTPEEYRNSQAVLQESGIDREDIAELML